MEMLIKNKDTHLFTLAFPKSGRETVILLHGGPGVPHGMTFLVKYLSRYFQVIMFHQRGTLKSPNPSHDYSLEGYTSDINRIAELFQLEKFHLFGHSWGGLYAQIYAQENRDRLLSLFLCSPASGTGRQWAETSLEITRYNRKKSSLPEFVALNLNAGLGLLGSDQGYKRFYSQALKNFSRGFRESHSEYFAVECIKAKAINQTIKTILIAPLLPIRQDPGCKVTITFGDQDIIGKTRKYVLERFPAASHYTIPASGHIPWSHNQPEFVRILKEHYSF
ncbi:alpha/beta fold hydrolase [Rufibacter latericius]|uniref:Alpha/beta hydrolase n=1 Tax=Rufibacter latericius TaxID=2487040 RepID=A0A3M9MUK3_9BACT|nr:alpha/beta hydrolase [Rufibacter latericius]RNI29196.1 alpha/beta hydrolase [Rufibacter latericius]